MQKQLISSWALLSNATQPSYSWFMCLSECLFQEIYNQCGCIDSEALPYEVAVQFYGTKRACNTAGEDMQCVGMVGERSEN